MIYFFIKYIIGFFILLFWRPRVSGRKNLAVRGKAIFVSNHIAMADPLLIALISPRTVHFMAKAELFRSLPGRLFFRSIFAFPVKRHTADLHSLKLALQLLEKGCVFGIFPEGKRSVTGDLDDFENGAAFLALRSGAPIVPIYIHPDSYESRRPRVAVGLPIDVSPLKEQIKGHSALTAAVRQEMERAIQALKVEMEEQEQKQKQ